MQSDRDLEEWAAETAAELEQDDDNRTREKTVLGADGAPDTSDASHGWTRRRSAIPWYRPKAFLQVTMLEIVHRLVPPESQHHLGQRHYE